MKNYITLEANREGYAPEQIRNTMTVRELINELEDLACAYGDETPVIYSNDNGYTYGSLNYSDIDIKENEEDEDE